MARYTIEQLWQTYRHLPYAQALPWIAERIYITTDSYARG